MAPPTAIWPGVKAIDISSRDGAPSRGASASVPRAPVTSADPGASGDRALLVTSAFGARLDPVVDRVVERVDAARFGAELGLVLFGVVARLVGFVVLSF